MIDYGPPDYYPNVQGPAWAAGAHFINVSPTAGAALPCGGDIPDLHFDNVRERPRRHLAILARPSSASAARTGCTSPAGAASGRRSTGAAAAARPWRSPATPPPPTRSAISRQATMPLVEQLAAVPGRGVRTAYRRIVSAVRPRGQFRRYPDCQPPVHWPRLSAMGVRAGADTRSAPAVVKRRRHQGGLR